MKSTDIEFDVKNEKYLMDKEFAIKKFCQNLPYLIFSEQLPDGQVDLEFRGGRIKIQGVFAIVFKFQYKVIQLFKAPAGDLIRKA